MKRYPDLEDHRGHVTSTLGLHFLAARHFINRRAVVSCLVEVKNHQFLKEEELTLNPSAAFDLYSSGGKTPSGHCSKTSVKSNNIRIFRAQVVHFVYEHFPRATYIPIIKLINVMSLTCG